MSIVSGVCWLPSPAPHAGSSQSPGQRHPQAGQQLLQPRAASRWPGRRARTRTRRLFLQFSGGFPWTGAQPSSCTQRLGPRQPGRNLAARGRDPQGQARPLLTGLARLEVWAVAAPFPGSIINGKSRPDDSPGSGPPLRSSRTQPCALKPRHLPRPWGASAGTPGAHSDPLGTRANRCTTR